MLVKSITVEEVRRGTSQYYWIFTCLYPGVITIKRYHTFGAHSYIRIRYIIYIPNNCVLYVPILIAFMIAYISFTAKIIQVRPWNLWRHEKILQCSTHGFYDIKEKLGILYNTYFIYESDEVSIDDV